MNNEVDNRIIFTVLYGKFMWAPAIQTEDARGSKYNMVDVENLAVAMMHITDALSDYEVLFKFKEV